MKKRIISFLTALSMTLMMFTSMPISVFAAGDIAINETNFPDEVFRSYVSQYIDKDSNGSLSAAEVSARKNITLVKNDNLNNLKGIEFFTELSTLICADNKNFSGFDISRNTKLTSLTCYGNNLTALDVSQNTELVILDCQNNQLTSLDVSNNLKLEQLYCQNNQLTSLDVSKNIALKNLSCSSNQLTSLDVSQNTALETFSCRINQYTASSCMLEPKDLPGNFNLSKASGWSNAEVTNGKIRSLAGGDATYTYDCGNSKTETFTIAFGNHSFENGSCTVCGADDPNASTDCDHVGGWGKYDGVCTICGFKCTHENTTAIPFGDSSPHHSVSCSTCGKETVNSEACTPADTWTTNATNHWKVCTKCNTKILSTQEEHNTTNSYGKDDAQHWAKCSVCGWEDTSNKAEHVYDQADDKCVCGNVKPASPKYTLTPATATIEVGMDNGQIFTLEGYTGEEKIVWEIDQDYADIDTNCPNNQCKVVGIKAGGPITLTAKSQSGDEVYGTATITFTDNTGHTHTGGTATCTQKAVCDVCGEEYGETLPHSFVNGSCTVCGAADPNGDISKPAIHLKDTLNNETKVISCGTSSAPVRITAVVENLENYTVTFECEPDDIVSITKNNDLSVNVQGIKVGSGTITVTATDGAKTVTATCSVTVMCDHTKDITYIEDADDADSGHWKKCKICGIIGEKIKHTMADVSGTAKEPTCGEAGKKADKECSVCGYEETGNAIPALGHNYVDGECTRCQEADPDYVPPHTHTLEAHEAVAATCTTGGNEAYWTCDCGKMFSDESGNNEITAVPATTALGHDYRDVPNSGKDPTCKEDGKKPDRKCSRCNDIKTGETLTATGKHTAGEPVQENAVNATCTAAGSYDEAVYCTVCNDEMSRTTKTIEKLSHDMEEVTGSAKAASCTEAGKEADKKCKNCDYTETGAEIKALGHDYRDVPNSGKDPTCKEDGKKPDRKCSRCDAKTDGAVIPATLMHTADSAVRENVKDASCTAAGSYDEVVYCTVCQTELSRVSKNGAMLPHETEEIPNSAKAAACTEDGKEADKKCKNCGYTETGTVIPALGHDYVDGKCTRCGEDEQTPTPVYTVTPATAAIKVGLDNGLIFTLEGYTKEQQIDWEIDQAYAAIYTYGFNINQCKVVGINAGGPITLTAKSIFGDEVFGTATITFTDDTVHMHTLISHAAVSAGCTDSGNEAYWTCSDCGKIFTDENGSNEINAVPTIPALGHNYVDGTCTRCGDVQSQTHTHTGGTATCTAKAVCDICGQEYGEMLPHSFAEGICTVCGTAESAHTHVFGNEWRYSDTRHWHECACGEKADEALHIPDGGTVTKQPTAYEAGSKSYYCTVCGGFIFSELIPAAGTESAPAASYTPPYSPMTFKEPYLQADNNKTGWEIISDNISETSDGETVEVNMNGASELPKNIVSRIQGRDIDLVLNMDGGFVWTINGMNVTKEKTVDMKVRKASKIPQTAVRETFGDQKTVQLDLRHSGDFGFTAQLTVDVGKRYSGMFANSYCYKSGNFEFCDSSKIVNGKADLLFTHASSWLITIENAPVLEDVSSGAAAYGSSVPIDMPNSSGSAVPVFAEEKKLRISNKKRRYRILKKRRLDDLVFVL